ncbi:MAG TPA: ABC transporter permease subunit [Saprospiraceae bacterium]|nr:ABC transporter permease subunit [Saprospiraceae bacterium]
MIAKALTLEFLKFRRYKPFWIILGLFVICYFALGFSIKSFIDYMIANREGPFEAFFETGLPLFDFVDVWQNMAYITFLFKYILAFVVMISICQEYTMRTIRQNMIDGLSRAEYVISKLGMVTVLSLLAGLLLLILGLFLGMLYSPVKSLDFVVQSIEFVPAFAFETFCFLAFAMFLSTLIRRTGFAIILFILYSLIMEPIATTIMKHEYELATWYFPIRAINNIIHLPFGKYIFQEVQDYVKWTELLVAGGWALIFIWLTWLLMTKRDL